MKTRGFSKCISAILCLCMILSCVSFSFVTANAVAVDDSKMASVSASQSNGDSFSWDNATVYFLLTDRFKNGNTANDHSYNRGLDQNGNVVTGIDTRATFHGGDFAGITQTIEDGYFDDLGVNALWISAPYEQLHGYVVGDNSSPSFAHYSYHGYYVLDYTQTDANFGTAEEFETLVDTAHKHGIRVVMDIVLNHAGYNSVYDMDEYGFGTVKSGWESSYFSHNNISNSTYHSFIDYDTSAADWAKWWGTDWIRCGVAGYTEGGGSDTTRTLEGLPDFMTESAKTVGIPPLLQTKWAKEGRLDKETNALKSYLAKNGKTQTVTNTISYWLSSWVREYGVDGFRCDTAKHVEYASWKTLKDSCVDALKEWRTNNPTKPGANWTDDFWMTGEHWDHNVGYGYDGYFTQGGFDSMINFETQGGGLLANGRVQGTYNNYAKSINTNDKFNALSYLSSHDSTLTRGNLTQIGSAFLLLPGGVQIYYGDETNRPFVAGMGNDGNGGAGHSLRSDMNWTAMDQNVLAHWQKVGKFRNNHISVGAGSNTDLTSSSGYAFAREYDKNGKSDKVAGVIYAGANSSVTIDVSKLWADGQNLVNAYDQSSAVVQGGKVTFNAGANGTILIEEPDGRPLMNVSGAAKFNGSQMVTVKLENCDSAKCSVDGGNKFVVQNGSTFAIGSTAYDGDTVEVVLEASNENGSSKAVFTFQKVAEVIEPTQPTDPQPTTPVEKAQLKVKTWDGSAPYAYAWVGTNTALLGAWPGKQLTEKDAEGYYVVDLDTTETYSVVLNNNNGAQSGDLTGLNGTSVLEVLSGSYNSKVVSTGSEIGGGGGGEVTDDSVTVRVKTFDGSAPYLYLWNDTDKAINGAWPGKQLTEKDEEGNYIFVANNTASLNAIVNKGPGSSQTPDITDLSGDVKITITNAEGTAFKLEKKEIPVSGLALLKKEAREVKAMTSTDYTAQTWANVNAIMPSVDALVAQGTDADESEIQAKITQLQTAKKALKLASASLTYAVVGQNSISGIAVPNASVKVNVGGKDYSTTSDDVTGAFTVNGVSVTASTTIKVSVTRNSLSADAYSYNMVNGNISGGITPTQPTAPTQPITQPTTVRPTAPTQPTTKPTVPTQPTTPAQELTVNATSNYFPASSNTFDVADGKVTVSYRLTSNMNVENTQWALTYDSSKLRYTRANNVNASGRQTITPSVSGLVYNATGNTIKGNFSNLDMYEFKNDEEFVTVTFDIIGTGTAKVDLEVEYLGVGYIDNAGNIFDEYVVDYSKICDVTGVKGFENTSIVPTTVVETKAFVLGDVNGDGKVSVDDVTLIEKYIVQLESLTATQKRAADYNGDGYITVKDATAIQKALVKA